jgi:hypothetical protein
MTYIVVIAKLVTIIYKANVLMYQLVKFVKLKYTAMISVLILISSVKFVKRMYIIKVLNVSLKIYLVNYVKKLFITEQQNVLLQNVKFVIEYMIVIKKLAKILNVKIVRRQLNRF